MRYSRLIKQLFLSQKQLSIHRFKLLLIIIALFSQLAPGQAFAGKNKTIINSYSENLTVPVFAVETGKNFDDVMEDLFVAIAENNFRLTQHAQIGKAIAERNQVSFSSATVVHFCNLNYAKQLLELAPDNLLRMPCRISVWPNNNGSSIIKVWLLPEDDKRTLDFAKKINSILKNIVTYSAR